MTTRNAACGADNVGPGEETVKLGSTMHSTASGTITARNAFAPCRL